MAKGQQSSAATPAGGLVERTVRLTLLAGLGVSVSLIVVGLLVALLPGRSLPHGVVGLSGALRAIGRGRPAGFVSLGLLALILTPVVRVTGSVIVFLRERDWRYTAVTAVVLSVMLVSLWVGQS
jgi:uncharacterized membrane protein